MSESEVISKNDLEISVENIGGIDRCDLEFSPGVTLLVGNNATNRTSLLTAFADVLGGSSASLKSDADEGSIALKLEDGVYSREYRRENGALVSSGTQYTDNGNLVDTFVRVLADNDARVAVRQGGDLRDVIMRPVDTAEIEQRLNERKQERRRIDDEIEEIERKERRLPKLEERRNELQSQKASLAEELEAARRTVEEYEASEAEAERAEQFQEELTSLREELQDVEDNIERQKSKLEALRDEREEVEAERSDLTVPEEELTAVEDDIERLERKQSDLDGTITDLTHIVQFNDELLSGDAPDIVEQSNDTLAELDPSSRTMKCWTCGNHVEQTEIESRLDGLRELLTERRQKRDELQDELDELEARRSELQQVVRQRDRLDSRLSDLAEEIEIREEKLSDLEAKREDVREELEAVESRVDETEELRENDLVDAYREISDLEFERGRVEQELDSVEQEIEDIEARLDDLDALEEQREVVSEEIEQLHNHIDDLEKEAVEAFNDHMAELLALLGYDNIERVWIERLVQGGGRNRSSTFSLHIVRESDDGTVYEDTVDNLSESECEIVGLVVALAGYLAHDAYEEVPVMLLDSLEAIDANRVADLVEYFSEYAPYLIIATLPEVDAELSNAYDRIPATNIGS